MGRGNALIPIRYAEQADCSARQQSEWLTAEEAAEHLRVKPRTLLLWTRQGKVKGYALSGTRRRVWRYLRVDLDAALLEKPCYPRFRRPCS